MRCIFYSYFAGCPKTLPDCSRCTYCPERENKDESKDITNTTRQKLRGD